MSSDSELRELLEIVASMDQDQIGVSLNELANRLGWSLEKTQERLRECVDRGLLEQQDSLYRVTPLGANEILTHRTEYLHDALMHRSRLSKLLEHLRGGRDDSSNHLQTRHGIDKETSAALQRSLLEFKGRVEEVVPLIELKRGDEGEVAFVVAGRGLLARLAAMGIVPKVKIRVLRAAPLHGPIEVSLRGTSIILGYGVASKIYVRRSSGAEY